jgi:serine/threonine protein kinase
LFARKIVRLIDQRAKSDFEAEAHVVSKLCQPGAHDNIVGVMQHGFLNNNLYGFFDMELCQLNLDAYIRSERDPSLLQQMQHLTINKETKLVKAMSIMIQIADGVSYFHRNGQVHRDLKPSNGNASAKC